MKRNAKNRRNRHKGYVNGWLGTSSVDLKLVLLLIFALPVGLYVMWSRECEWHRFMKSGVSLFVVALLSCVLIFMPPLPEARLEGGVDVISYKNDNQILAPLKPSGIPETAQIIVSRTESTLISVPTPAPSPYWVRCNDNGKYYHIGNCRYIYEHTPTATLKQALDAGKTACPDCKPPKEVTN